MANEIRATYDSGKTLYSLIFDTAGQVWDTLGSNWENYAAAQQGNYDIGLSETPTASGQYRGTFPAAISAGAYSVVLFLQAGGSPAASDQRIGGTGIMYWDGSAEITIADIEGGGGGGTTQRKLGLTASYDGTTVKLGLWLEEDGLRQTDVTSITDVEIFNAVTASRVVDLGDDTIDSADGVFYFAGAASLAYNTPYYVKATVNKGGYSYSMQAGLVRI